MRVGLESKKINLQWNLYQDCLAFVSHHWRFMIINISESSQHICGIMTILRQILITTCLNYYSSYRTSLPPPGFPCYSHINLPKTLFYINYALGQKLSLFLLALEGQILRFAQQVCHNRPYPTFTTPAKHEILLLGNHMICLLWHWNRTLLKQGTVKFKEISKDAYYNEME